MSMSMVLEQMRLRPVFVSHVTYIYVCVEVLVPRGA